MRFFRTAAALIGLLCAIPAAAQQPPTPSEQTRAAYDAAFQETLKNPTDPATLIRYAGLAVQVGDIEAAISALERLLLIDGDQPRIKLELGVLYFRLGSYEAARTYLESARGSASAAPETRDRAAQYLKEVDSKVSPSQFSGDVLVGLGYSTNANSGAGGVTQTFGATTVTTPNISQQPDFNVVGAATIRHRYDLNRQDNGALESEFSLYTSRQFQVTQANVTLLEFTTGPRTSPFEDGSLNDLTVRPMLTGRYVAVQDQVYYWAWGAGLEATTPLGSQTNALFSVFGRRREYLNNSTLPFNNQSSGNEGVGVLDLRVELTPSMTLGLGGNFTRFVASVQAQSYTEFGFGTSLEVRFANPLGFNGRNWSAVASASMAQAAYDAPDPNVDPVVLRTQNDLNLGFILTIPLDNSLALIGQANFTQRTASLSTYAYEAFTTLVGIGWRF